MSKERKTMNLEINLPVMAEEIKQLMTRLKYNVSDKGVPELTVAGEDIFGDLNIHAAYAPTVHTIFINETKPCADEHLLEIIAHELTHAYQDMAHIVDQEQVCIDPSTDAYWEQKFEREAYTVGATWVLFNTTEDEVDLETRKGLENLMDNNPDTLATQWIETYRNAFNTQNALG